MYRVAASTFGVITVVGIIRGLVAQPQCSVVDRGGIVSVTVGVTASVIITVAVASTTSINSNNVPISRAGAGVYVSIQMEPIKCRVVQVVLGCKRRKLGVCRRVAGDDAGREGVHSVGTVSCRRG